jgi:hypothetical protein
MPSRASGRPFGVPTSWRMAEGNTEHDAMASRARALRGQRPRARTESPCSETGRSRVRLRRSSPQAASGSPRAHADDARTREVGQGRSTAEVAEQRRASGCGGGGGKDPGQGKLARAQRAPDSAPAKHAKRARASTSSSEARVDREVHRAPCSGRARRAADPEMAQRRCVQGRDANTQ